MRRKDREMPEAFGWAVADKCEWAVLGLIDADGEVYPVPVTIVREGSRVYFHSAQSGEKVECLRRLLCERHTPELMEKFPSEAARSLGRTGVWCIETETITAKRKRYDSTGVELKYQREE